MIACFCERSPQLSLSVTRWNASQFDIRPDCTGEGVVTPLIGLGLMEVRARDTALLVVITGVGVGVGVGVTTGTGIP